MQPVVGSSFAHTLYVLNVASVEARVNLQSVPTYYDHDIVYYRESDCDHQKCVYSLISVSLIIAKAQTSVYINTHNLG